MTKREVILVVLKYCKNRFSTISKKASEISKSNIFVYKSHLNDILNECESFIKIYEEYFTDNRPCYDNLLKAIENYRNTIEKLGVNGNPLSTCVRLISQQGESLQLYVELLKDDLKL